MLFEMVVEAKGDRDQRLVDLKEHEDPPIEWESSMGFFSGQNVLFVLIKGMTRDDPVERPPLELVKQIIASLLED